MTNFLRKLLTLLSCWYPNQKVSEVKDFKLRKELDIKLKKFSITKKNLKKTHQKFNKQIFDLLRDKNIKNFLRNSFIQKMFFLHNRLFVFKELSLIKKSPKWRFYKKILKEDNVGNPIRYFLYFNSSGNRINHVFFLFLIEEKLKINLKKIEKIFEFGGGYGCMARIFSKINQNIKYICFDTYYVNLLQYYYLSHNNLNVGFSKHKNYFLTSQLKKNINSKNDLFIANWSLSETPINYRKKFNNIIQNSHYIFISFQQKFENIDNLKYFNDLKNKLKKKYKVIILKNKFYKGNFFNKQNHYFFIGRKL